MYPLIILIMASLRDYFLEVHWDLLMVNLGYIDGKVLGSDEGIKLGSTDVEVIGTILGKKISRWQS